MRHTKYMLISQSGYRPGSCGVVTLTNLSTIIPLAEERKRGRETGQKKREKLNVCRDVFTCVIC